MTNSHEKIMLKESNESPERQNNLLTHDKEQAATQAVKPDLTVNTSCDLEKCMLLHYADISNGNWMHIVGAIVLIKIWESTTDE